MPAYRKQIVTFLDIMGFRELVHANDADAIVSTLDAIKASAAAPVEGEGEATSIISFSDSIIRARPCARDPVSALLYEIEELASAQWELMESGILVRGGTTMGEVLVAPDRAFGPAFIRAYDLESKHAASPRVILDPDKVKEFAAHIAARDHAGKREFLDRARSALRFDADRKWFVDYISSAYRKLSSDDHLSSMRRHRETIIEVANEFEPASGVFQKYAWLIVYFNASAVRFHPGVNGLRILESDVPGSDANSISMRAIS